MYDPNEGTGRPVDRLTPSEHWKADLCACGHPRGQHAWRGPCRLDGCTCAVGDPPRPYPHPLPFIRTHPKQPPTERWGSNSPLGIPDPWRRLDVGVWRYAHRNDPCVCHHGRAVHYSPTDGSQGHCKRDDCACPAFCLAAS